MPLIPSLAIGVVGMLMKRTIASSGSKLGSTPNSNPAPAPPEPPAAPEAPASPMASSGIPAPRSAARMGDDINASERRTVPGATDTRCLSNNI